MNNKLFDNRINRILGGGSDLRTLETIMRYFALKKCSNPKELATTWCDSFRITVLHNDFESGSTEMFNNMFDDEPVQDLWVKFAPYCKNIEPLSVADLEQGWEELNTPECPAETAAAELVSSTATKPKIFRNKNEKIIVFLGENGRISLSLFDRIASSILPRIAPWLFPKMEKEYIDIFLDVYQTATGRTSEKLIEYTNKVISSWDEFDKAYKEGAIKAWADFASQEGIANAKDNLISATSTLNRIISDYLSAKRKYDQYAEVYNALKSQDTSKLQDDIISAFMDRDNVKIVNNLGGELLIEICSTLNNYDAEEFMEKYDNKSSYLFDEGEKYANFMKAIFVDELGEIVSMGRFTIRSNNSYAVQKEMDIRSTDIIGYPNPHLNHYGCQGLYENIAVEAFKKYDIDSVLDTLLSEVSNINWNDSAVVDVFLEDVSNLEDDGKPFIVPKVDGKLLRDESGHLVMMSFTEFTNKYLPAGWEYDNG